MRINQTNQPIVLQPTSSSSSRAPLCAKNTASSITENTSCIQKIFNAIRQFFNSILSLFCPSKPSETSESEVKESDKGDSSHQAKKVWDKARVGKELYKNNTLVSDETFTKVKIADDYLSEIGFELSGVKADGNCFLSAFLGSLKTLKRTIPLLDLEQDKVSYLRGSISKQYISSPNNAKHPDRADEIKENGVFISALEGDLLANCLSIPMRILTPGEGFTSDLLAFPEYNKERQEWSSIPKEKRPDEYIFIVDLGGHFVFAKPQSKK